MSEMVTLRRAAKLRNRLELRLLEIRQLLTRHNVEINVYDPDINAQLATKRDEYNNVMARYNAVSAALFNVRSLLGTANATSGINELLAEQAALMGQRAVISPLSKLESAPTADQVIARVDGAREQLKNASRYGAETTLAFGIISQDMINDARTNTQQIQVSLDQIQDRLENINSTTKIELSDVDLALLQSEQLI